MSFNTREHEIACRIVLDEAEVQTAADLAAMSLKEWLLPDLGIGFRTLYASKVIEFMMTRGICFRDLNPAQVFKTRINEDDPLIDVRTYNCLTREGLVWVEILPYFTAEALGKIRNFGAKSLKRTNNILARHGLSLQEADGQ